MKVRIEDFDTQLLRSPLYPLEDYATIPKDPAAIPAFVRGLFKDAVFREAVFLASPELCSQWAKRCEEHPDSDGGRLDKSILKYYMRATTNCVPFGLFSSYAVLNAETPNGDRGETGYQRFSNLDMSFLHAALQVLNRDGEVRRKLTYRVNDTTYTLGEHYRYVETSIEGDKRHYNLSALERDPVLDLVLSACRKGQTIEQLTKILLDAVADIDAQQAEDYLHELIDAQILTSSLALCLNGKPPLKQCLELLDACGPGRRGGALQLISTGLHELDEKLHSLDEKLGHDTQAYEALYRSAKRLPIAFEEKYLVNTNLKRTHSTHTRQALEADRRRLKEAIAVLARFNGGKAKAAYRTNRHLEAFAAAFTKRYEAQEVPLLEALDNVSGIGYIQDHKHYNGFSALIDDLKLPAKPAESETLHSDPRWDALLTRLSFKALRQGRTRIDLKAEDLSAWRDQAADLTGTFSVLYNKIGDKICLQTAGGSTAMQYIGRFTCNDPQLNALAEAITSAEEQLFPAAIPAEIIHPTSSNRAGNVSIRKLPRKYEIPILAKTADQAIPLGLDDLLIRVERQRIVLRSKKYQRVVIPFLSCAHNFHWNALPAYQLLCDLQLQYRPNPLSLNTSEQLFKHFSFIPRIEWGTKLILSPALWRFTKAACQGFLDGRGEPRMEAFQTFKRENQIPRYIQLSEPGSDPLLLDTENECMLGMLCDILRKHGAIQFRECLYDFSEQPGTTPYANEYLAFFKAAASEPAREVPSHGPGGGVKRCFGPGEEWMYFKLYVGVANADQLLATAIKAAVTELKAQEAIDKWFFIRYNDPDFHLRLRFHFKAAHKRDQILETVNRHLKQAREQGLIWKTELDTYERELERYRPAYIETAESLFYHDSERSLDLIARARAAGREASLWLYGLKGLDDYLEAFDLDTAQRYALVARLYRGFCMEFHADKGLKRQIDAKFRGQLDAILKLFQAEDAYAQRMAEHRKAIRTLAAPLVQSLDEGALYVLLGSYLHMHVNRMIKANPRIHELVLYGMLEKFYKREIGIQKHCKPAGQATA